MISMNKRLHEAVENGDVDEVINLVAPIYGIYHSHANNLIDQARKNSLKRKRRSDMFDYKGLSEAVDDYDLTAKAFIGLMWLALLVTILLCAGGGIFAGYVILQVLGI